jgi:glycosyltransferase involved in cell wall biosynthesis
MARVVEEPVHLVDVNIPACGRSDYVVEAIESVLRQSLQSWRLRISDDGPGGGAVEAAVRPYLDDPRISYSANGRRLGASGNATACIQAGTAPYVHLLHDDDMVEEGFLERHVRFLEGNPDCGLVFSSYVEVDGEGREIARAESLAREGVYAADEFLPLMLQRNLPTPASVVVRRAAYEAVGPRFDGRFAAIYDYEMWFRIATRFPVGYLASWDVHWRRHGEQISYSSYRGEEYLLLLQHMDQLLQRTRPDLRLSPTLQRRKEASALLTASIDALEQGDVPRARRRLHDALRHSKRLLLDPRVAAAAVGIAFGEPGRRAAVAGRRALHRRGIRLVYHPYPPAPVVETRSVVTGDRGVVGSPTA